MQEFEGQPMKNYYQTVLEPITSTMVRLMDLTALTCRKPMDTVEGVMFCGKKITGRYGVYCDHCGPKLVAPLRAVRC